MTTQPFSAVVPGASGSKLNALRCALTGVVVLTVTFALCWSAAAVGLVGGSHAYVAIFTNAPVASVAALATGLCWSVIVGAVWGVLIAFSYNAFAFFEGR